MRTRVCDSRSARKNSWKTMLSAILLGAFVYFATPTPACGPFFPSAIFTYTQHPDFPLIAFARGQLGILQPTYYRAYLFAAYRNLSGAPLSKKEQVAALSLWRERMTANWHPGQRPKEVAKATSPWLEARKQVPGAGAVTGLDGADPIGITRPTGQYSTYYNCLADAFATARLTLQARIAKFGAGSTEVKEWLAAQDQVFANCSKPGGNSATIVPAAAHPEDNPLVRSDRAYQTAAAYFYNEEFPKAESLFAEIAKDKNSEWTSVARLLIARIYIREATLSHSEKPGDIDLAPLAKAEAQLQGLLADKNVAEMHPAAQRLLGFVEFRLHPQERLAQLERALTHRDASADFEQDLCDYTWLLGRNSTEREKNEAADWIFTFQGPPGEFVADHSVERWQQAKTLPWLIAAIANIPATHPQAGAILAAAAKVGPDSPAFATISFHRARLLAESNQNVAARAELDALLEKQSSRFPPSSRNLLLAERLRVAQNFEEFLKYAPREAAAVSEDMNGDEIPDDENALEAGLSATPSGSHPDSQPPRFDADAAQYFNRRLPLNLLKQATLSESLPNPLRRQVARAAWVRAVVLGDDATAQALAPIVASFTPEMKDDLDKYSSEQRKDNRKFMAMLTILKSPAMRPYITAGVERQGGLNEISEFRDNWWCGWSLGSGPGGDWLPRLGQSLASIHPLENSGAAVGRNAQQVVESPQFLTEAERTATDQEWERLSSVAAAPNYLTQAVLEYAKSHADDERVPEALHLAVRATRYGCTDSDTGNLSKEAFDLLHARYPHSPWTEQTKYWFSGGAE